MNIAKCKYVPCEGRWCANIAINCTLMSSIFIDVKSMAYLEVKFADLSEEFFRSIYVASICKFVKNNCVNRIGRCTSCVAIHRRQYRTAKTNCKRNDVARSTVCRFISSRVDCVVKWKYDMELGCDLNAQFVKLYLFVGLFCTTLFSRTAFRKETTRNAKKEAPKVGIRKIRYHPTGARRRHWNTVFSSPSATYLQMNIFGVF